MCENSLLSLYLVLTCSLRACESRIQKNADRRTVEVNTAYSKPHYLFKCLVVAVYWQSFHFAKREKNHTADHVNCWLMQNVKYKQDILCLSHILNDINAKIHYLIKSFTCCVTFYSAFICLLCLVTLSLSEKKSHLAQLQWLVTLHNVMPTDSLWVC